MQLQELQMQLDNQMRLRNPETRITGDGMLFRTTMVVEVQNASAAHFVPILRPILPQAGHMAAHTESNMIAIVDRYGNARRVRELIRKMDYQAAQQ